MVDTHMIQLVYAAAAVAQVLIGIYCAHLLTAENPLWVRLVVLSPALTSILILWCMCDGSYVAYFPDIIDSSATTFLYALVASRLSGNPWLDIRSKK